jgi:hypothetical protein
VWIADHEFSALMGLPGWHLALFAHLIVRSNFKTGHGRTGHGELINALTPDQPERGPRLWAPTKRDIRRALASLEAARLVELDKLASEQVQALVFHVAPRERRGVASEKRASKLAPPSYEGKQGTTRPGIRPPLSTEKPYSPTPQTDGQLSTGPEAVRARLVAVAQAVAARGVRSRAPKGA